MMRVRFAPSPTGYLHVGNARIAIANALFARRHSAKFLLRIDDTDLERSRPEYEQGIEQDLAWLGIAWDETFKQSSRLEAYDRAADRLRASGRLYPCFESEEELRFKRDQRLKRGLAPVYDRAMLKLTTEQRAQAEANGKTPYWRFKLSDTTVEWNDLVLGRRGVKLPTVSDPVLIRADGTYLYTFTSVVDDIDSEVSHILRGEDHVTNTGVQLDIFSALNSNPSKLTFGHLPLLIDSDGGKLSKRLEGLSLRALRQDGMEPAAILAYLARLGTSDSPEVAPLETLAQSYDLSRVSRSPARFDVRQLLALNRRVLHDAAFAAVRDRLPAAATPEFWDAVRGNLDLLSEARHWWTVVSGDLVPPVQENQGDFFQAALDHLPPAPWTTTTWSTWTAALKEATGRKGKTLFMPLRLALTGEEHGPELANLLPLIGPERVAMRLRLSTV
jgi:glutamyl-tRNA synthetase